MFKSGIMVDEIPNGNGNEAGGCMKMDRINESTRYPMGIGDLSYTARPPCQ